MAISDKLAKIKQQAAELTAKTDAFNVAIEQIEKGLDGSGVEFWWTDGVALGESRWERDRGAMREHLLGYAKLADKWCLAARHLVARFDGVDISGNEEWTEESRGDMPLRRAPRLIRVAAAEHLEGFLDALSDAIARMTAAFDKASALTNEPALQPPYKGSGHANPRPKKPSHVRQRVQTSVTLGSPVEGVIDSHSPMIKVKLTPAGERRAIAELDGDKELSNGSYQVRVDGPPLRVFGIDVIK